MGIFDDIKLAKELNKKLERFVEILDKYEGSIPEMIETQKEILKTLKRIEKKLERWSK